MGKSVKQFKITNWWVGFKIYCCLFTADEKRTWAKTLSVASRFQLLSYHRYKKAWHFESYRKIALSICPLGPLQLHCCTK